MDRMLEQTHAEGEDRPRRIPPLAEALGYIGGALALAAIVVLLVRLWSKLGLVGHVGVGAALAIAGLVGGYTLIRHEGASAQRLAQFLLLAGVAGVAFAVGFATRDVLVPVFDRAVGAATARSQAAEWGWFAGASALALSAGIVWWGRRTVLQHLVFGLGVAATALLALPLVPTGGPEWGFGATLVAVAIVWGALSLAGMLPPRAEGLVLSTLGIAGGIELMSLADGATLVWPLWLGAAACAVLIWAGSRLDQLGVLGIAAVGLAVFSAQLVSEYVGFGVGTAIALITVGFVVLGFGVRLTLRLTDDSSRNWRIAAEVAGYLGIALAMGGAGILFAQSWDDLGTVGRILVPLVGAAVAFGSGLLLGREETATARRLSQTLLGIGVLSTGITGAMVARPIAESVFDAREVYENDPVSNWTFLAGALTATVVGGITWWVRRGSMTQIALISGIAISVVAAMNFSFVGPEGAMVVPQWSFGLLLVAIGTAWVVLGARGLMTPVRTALAAGSFVALQGLQMSTDGGPNFVVWPALLGIGYGIAGIVASIYLRRAILLGFGAIAVIMFSMVLVLEVFGDRVGAPIVLLVMGVVFIAVAIAAVKISPRLRRSPKNPEHPQPLRPHAGL